jgi:hypothetical protein
MQGCKLIHDGKIKVVAWSDTLVVRVSRVCPMPVYDWLINPVIDMDQVGNVIWTYMPRLDFTIVPRQKVADEIQKALASKGVDFWDCKVTNVAWSLQKHTWVVSNPLSVISGYPPVETDYDLIALKSR